MVTQVSLPSRGEALGNFTRHLSTENWRPTAEFGGLQRGTRYFGTRAGSLQDQEYIALARLSLVSPLKNGAPSDGFQVFFTNPPGCRQLTGSRLGLEVN